MQNLVGHGKEIKSIPWIKFIVSPRSSRRLLENGLLLVSLAVSPGTRVPDVMSHSCSQHKFLRSTLCQTPSNDIRFLLRALPTFINPHTYIGPCMSFLVLCCSEIESYYTQYFTTYFFHLAKYCGHLYQLVDKIHSCAIFSFFPFCSDFLNTCASTIHCHHPQPLPVPNIHFRETATWDFKYGFEKA